ncbi:hypothetical protein [Streptomyces sirii]|uniref:hypothetical protein n=1 Tax=Streptomyces sirii TaxID=3127701 RepID=UPI003D361F95
MTDENTFTVGVELRGHRHTVVISADWDYSLGLFGIGRVPEPPESARLRVLCPDCDAEGMFRVTAPTSDWKRPFKVLQVTHHEPA